MSAPKKDELDKVVSLGGFTIKKRDMDYIRKVSEIKRVRQNDLIREMVAYYRKGHHIQFIFDQREEQIHNDELQLDMDRTRYDNAKKISGARIYDFIKANDGFKFEGEKAALRSINAFKNTLEKGTGLLIEDIDTIYERVLLEYKNSKEKDMVGDVPDPASH